MRKNLRMPEELNALVRDRTRYKGDLSKTIIHCVENVDLHTVPLHEPAFVTETAMQIMLDDDLCNRLYMVASTRNTSVNRLINSAVASCLYVKSPVDMALEEDRKNRRRNGA